MNKIDEIIFELKKEFQIFLIKNNLYSEFVSLIQSNITDFLKKTFIEKINDIKLKEYATKIMIELREVK